MNKRYEGGPVADDTESTPDWLKRLRLENPEFADAFEDYETTNSNGYQEKDVDEMKNKAKGAHCVKCGAKGSETALASYAGAKLVTWGEKGSNVECVDTSECHERKDKKGGKSTDTKPPYYGGGGQMTTWPKCRHEATPAFSLHDIVFYGGSESKVNGQFFDSAEWVVVSLLGYSKKDAALWCKEPTWFNFLKRYTLAPSVVIDWPDMGVPPLKPGFWAGLIALCKKNKVKKVLFYCVGGHGRTGTALSAVLIEGADQTAPDAVSFIRKNYCKEAVETTSQVDYLKMLAAVVAAEKEVPAKAAKTEEKEAS